jgi:pyridoxal 5'-phosphate synthase pdxS subunit
VEKKMNFEIKDAFAKMLKGGIIMDVTSVEEAKLAQECGACAVMALEKNPQQIRKEGGIARMADPKLIKDIMSAVTIPVMAKVRIGHFAEANILEHLGVDFIDESEVLTPVCYDQYIDKKSYKVPFVSGARNLEEALRRINEGAAMIRTKGEAGTGDVSEAVKHIRTIYQEIQEISNKSEEELIEYAKKTRVPVELVKKTIELKRLPVVNFAAGGIATPSDISLLMQLGADGVFVGSGIFNSSNPKKRGTAMAMVTSQWNNIEVLAKQSEDLGEPMFGVNIQNLTDKWSTRTEVDANTTSKTSTTQT